MMKGYKVLLPDWTSKHGDFKYEIGKTYGDINEDEIELCWKGYHFCEKLVDCFNYYDFNSDNVVVEIEATGKIIEGGDKCVTNEIKIARQIEWEKVVELCNSGDSNSGYRNSGDSNSGYRNSGDSNSGYRNSGDWNSGYRNSGDWNSGYRNSGDWNSGYRNSGDWNSGDWNSGYRNSGDWNSGDWNSGYRNSGDRNSGDWNSGDWNSGLFNTDTPKLRMFNKQSDWTYEDWWNSNARLILDSMPTDYLKWVWDDDMTDEEKEQHPEYKTTGGYLKLIEYKQKDRQKWWDELEEDRKKAVMSLPNFDKKIFKEITGIEVKGK